MRYLHTIALSIIIMAFAACGEAPKTTANKEPAQKAPVQQNIDPAMAAGFKLLQDGCFSCHNPNPDAQVHLAPSLAEIKKAYTEGVETFEGFEEKLSRFVNNPSAENVIMPEALEKYGPMPKFDYSEQQLRDIANYIFHQPVEAPDWYEASFTAEKKKYQNWKPGLSKVEQGKEFALKTKGVLGKNLLGAIKAKGTAHAVEFCNTRAIQLTDSMAEALHASVIRVSDQPRNPENQAEGEALSYILEAKKLLAEGKKIKPQMQTIDGKDVGYYPIMTNAMCLQCHGKPEADIEANTLAKLASLYPEDKAKGYGPNELRGIWVVEMDKR